MNDYKGQQVLPEVPRRSPGKKDTRRWCKGKPGREHVTGVAQRPTYGVLRECGWNPFWRHPYGNDLCDFRWSCYHAIFCEGCGKVLQHTLGAECPDYRPKPEGYLHTYTRSR